MKSQAIWHPDCSSSSSLVSFRQRLNISVKVQSSRLFLSASGDMVVYLNGSRVHSSAFPAKSQEAFCDAVDMSTHLKIGNNELVVSVLGSGLDDWFRAECEIEGVDGKYRSVYSGTSWQVYHHEAWSKEGNRFTYVASEDERELDQSISWRTAKITEGLKTKLWDPLDVKEYEIFPACVDSVGELEANASLSDSSTLLPLTTAKFVYPESLLQIGKTEALVQTRDEIRSACVFLDLGRTVFGCPRLRLNGSKGAIIDLGFALDRDGFKNTQRYVCKDGVVEWTMPLAVSCRYVCIRVARSFEEMRINSFSILEQIYEVKDKMVLNTEEWLPYWKVGRNSLSASRRAIYIGGMDGSRASGLQTYILGLNDIYRTGSIRTLGATLASAYHEKSFVEVASQALCAIEYSRYAEENGTGYSFVSVAAERLLSMVYKDTSAFDDLMVEAACKQLSQYFTDRSDDVLSRKFISLASIANGKLAKKWSPETGLFKNSDQENVTEHWIDSLALYFDLVDVEDVLCVIDRLRNTVSTSIDLWLAFFQVGALWKWADHVNVRRFFENNWGMLSESTGSTWSDRLGVVQTLPGPDALIGRYALGIRSIAECARIIEVRPIIEVLGRVSGTLKIRDNSLSVDCSLNGSGYLSLVVEQDVDNELHVAVPRVNKRFPTVLINDETVWRNEKIYTNFQVQNVNSEKDHVVFIFHKMGRYHFEVLA